tara:strand:- start:197 stop:454 length:258 start_codon:yes stop_codon:yes gene_type:complete
MLKLFPHIKISTSPVLKLSGWSVMKPHTKLQTPSSLNMTMASAPEDIGGARIDASNPYGAGLLCFAFVCCPLYCIAACVTGCLKK